MDVELLGLAGSAEVVDLLVGEPWPFHAGATPTPVAARERLAGGWLDGPGTETHGLRVDGVLVGLVRLTDLDDETAELDLRLRAAHRGRGLGTAALRWATDHVFGAHPPVRFEAMTRVDNTAMRAVLDRCGWVLEAHHREAWPTASGSRVSAVGYAVLRSDWAAGTRTPVDWTA